MALPLLARAVGGSLVKGAAKKAIGGQKKKIKPEMMAPGGGSGVRSTFFAASSLMPTFAGFISVISPGIFMGLSQPIRRIPVGVKSLIRGIG